MLPLRLLMGGSESDFCVFITKFNRIKSATKFLVVKTNSDKVV